MGGCEFSLKRERGRIDQWVLNYLTLGLMGETETSVIREPWTEFSQCSVCSLYDGPPQAGLKSRGGWHSKAQALVRVILRSQWSRATRLAHILTGEPVGSNNPDSIHFKCQCKIRYSEYGKCLGVSPSAIAVPGICFWGVWGARCYRGWGRPTQTHAPHHTTPRHTHTDLTTHCQVRATLT